MPRADPSLTPAPRPLPTSEDFLQQTDNDLFLSWLFAEAGLSARHYRRNALLRRLPACLRALRVPDIAHARRALRHHPPLIPVAIDALLLGVTEFFRDAAVFDCLERELTPVLQTVRGAAPVRVWSAACSDGAELYSVAMLLADRDALHRCELLGTDCRDDAVARAASATFPPASLRGLSPERVDRFFEATVQDDARGGNGNAPGHAGAPSLPSRRVIEPLRRRTHWRRADVLQAAEPGPWHVLLCRNMAMYLQPGAAERLWHRLASVLAPGGLLVVGKAERPVAASAAGLLAPVGPCVYRRLSADPSRDPS